MDPNLNTEKITPELIRYVVDKIVQEVQPDKIFLFGSHARGDFDGDSDLDLFIEVAPGQGSSRSIRRKIDSLLWGRRFPVDLIVRNTEEIKLNIEARNSFYIHHIFEDGKVLYEKKN